MNPVVIALLLLINDAFFLWTMRRRLPPLFSGRWGMRWDRLEKRPAAFIKFGFG